MADASNSGSINVLALHEEVQGPLKVPYDFAIRVAPLGVLLVEPQRVALCFLDRVTLILPRTALPEAGPVWAETDKTASNQVQGVTAVLSLDLLAVVRWFRWIDPSHLVLAMDAGCVEAQHQRPPCASPPFGLKKQRPNPLVPGYVVAHRQSLVSLDKNRVATVVDYGWKTGTAHLSMTIVSPEEQSFWYSVQ